MRDGPARAGALIWAAFAVAPVAAGAAWALAYSVGAAGALGDGWTLRPWASVLGGAEFWQSLVLSAAVACAATLLALAAGLAAVLFLRPQLHRGPLAAAVALPLATPPIVGAFLALQILGASGLLARLAAAAGLISIPSEFPGLVNDPLAIGIVLVHASLAAPYFALLMAQSWKDDRVGRVSEVAASLGASPGQRRRRVEIPLLLRRASGTALLMALAVLGSYEVPLLLGRQAPQMLSVLTMRKLARYDLTDRPDAFAIALLYAAITTAGVWWASRLTRKTDAR